MTTDDEVRRFTFACKSGDPVERAGVNRRIDAAVLALQGLIVKHVWEVFPHARGAELDELVQDCRIALALKILPRYDASAGVSVATFANRCIRNCVLDLAKVRRRARKRRPHPQPLQANLYAPSGCFAESVETLAEKVLSDPATFLNPVPAAIVAHLRDHDTFRFPKLCRDLGLVRRVAPRLVEQTRRDVARLLNDVPCVGAL